jgi:DNA ligase 1
MKMQFLMLAHNFDTKSIASGKFVSEKLDGIRALWDGGITTGMLARTVPWANTDKDHIRKEETRATGLWTRYGHVIQAPVWFINKLPSLTLDGELWAGRGQWELCSSITRTLNPDLVPWAKIQFRVFDSPSLETLWQNRDIDVTQGPSKVMYRKTFKDILVWVRNHLPLDFNSIPTNWTFETAQQYLTIKSKDWPLWCVLHKQAKLPLKEVDAQKQLQKLLEDIDGNGGEGVMLRGANSQWEPIRSYKLLKAKSQHDAEGTVVGYRIAERGKIFGKMGALILELDNGKELCLSGFTDAEREWGIQGQVDYSFEYPGSLAPTWFDHKLFPRKTRVTFKYRELSQEGVPKEARYLRIVD